MQKFVVAPLSVAIAALLLAGCGTSSSSGPEAGSSAPAQSSAAAAPAPAATAVTGTVSLQDQGIAVTPQAQLELSLVDMTHPPGATINKQDFSPPAFPQAFRIPFTASAINPTGLYVLQATMQDNGRTWSTKLQQPVLTRGQPATVNLTLVAEPTAAEKMLADFENAKRQTGGMKVKSGTASKIGESRSWQVFSDARGVEFIIEQVNHADQGFTKTQTAYREGRPWVVVQEQMPKQDAPATATLRAGWNDAGELVLKQDVAGGKTSVLSDSEATALHKQAAAQFKKFSAQH